MPLETDKTVEVLAGYTDKKNDAFKLLVDLRKYCLETVINNNQSESTEEELIQMASSLENYLINGKADTTN